MGSLNCADCKHLREWRCYSLTGNGVNMAERNHTGHCCLEFAPKGEASSPFARIAQEIGALVSEKQAAYGDSFGKAGQVMRILYGESIPPEKIDDALTVVRVVDKLFRIATRKDAFGESPWRDIVGYGLLAVARDEKTRP